MAIAALVLSLFVASLGAVGVVLTLPLLRTIYTNPNRCSSSLLSAGNFFLSIKKLVSAVNSLKM